ncbi:Endonuclease [Actinidia chinensis var. chinensis]|uniref:Endonuclease n=1 Tax=Actinidia chinensis var. chinensis TaxID=1590841 RepID=A0A2R6QH64_ACTCC|nr:Endonuclease [Actinidia chinensis var. chinensis]
MPCRPEHLSDEKVDEFLKKLLKTLLDALMPFQLEGVRFGLQRGGRCLIADEMGLGKTLQAIAIACCFMSEGPILVVCPAVLRFSWAEELERWLPFCLPADIHLVFGHKSNPVNLPRRPRVVVISYTMLHRLRKSILEQDWALLIVDESHHVRCTKKTSEPGEIKAVLDVASKINHIVLLSGTPSLSRPFDIFHQINMLWPGLLGKNKFEFAKTYCAVKFIRGCQGKTFQDFSNGVRLEELNVLLKQTVMIRRLKKDVQVQLPPKRRQIINLQLKRSDIISAMAASEAVKSGASGNDDAIEEPKESSDEPDESGGCDGSLRMLSKLEIGVAKLSGFLQWLSMHPIFAETDGGDSLELGVSSPKMIIFAHYHKVLDGVQEFVCDKGIGFVRIDGHTPAQDRQLAVHSFRSLKEVKIAIIGIKAGGVGLDFTSAQHVVFLDLPQDPSQMRQAEDRAHRRGQTKAVNIYIFCAKDTLDESRWRYLNKSLRCVSSTTDGKYDAIKEIEVESVSYLETTEKTSASSENMRTEMTNKRTEEQNESGGDTSQEDNFHAEADISDLDMWNRNVPSGGGLVAIASEGKTGCAEIISTHNLLQDSDNMDHLEKGDKLFSQRPVELIEADSSSSIQIECLRFEVSQYTGRIHVYTCIPGIDSRPRPLFENFLRDELESSNCPANNDETASKSIKDNPTYRHALLEFINEWKNLKPIQRNRLLAKPLQLPLSIELCYLKENLNHDSGGLLRGRSNRRTTPLHEISHLLPPNAVWNKVHLSSGHGKKEKEYTQGWTVTGEPLCKLCQTPCKSKNAKSPEFLEDLFCNLSCYEEYRLRTSNRFLRQELFQIERGICTNCQLNCHQLVEHIRPLSYANRQKYIEKVAPKLARHKKLHSKLVRDPSEGNAWHADHIVPVHLGGGECRLENVRTLCVACHADVTAAQRAQRRLERIKAKKQLKVIIDGLKENQKTDQTTSNLTDQDPLESTVEEELFIKVPGSAYSGAGNDVRSKSMNRPPTLETVVNQQ